MAVADSSVNSTFVMTDVADYDLPSSTENTPRVGGMSDSEDGGLSSVSLGRQSSAPIIPSAAAASSLTTSNLIQSPPIAPISPFHALSPNSSVTFTDFPRVTHSFSLVMGQVQAGLERLKTVAEFIKHICHAKNTYAQQLLKTSATYATGGRAGSPIPPSSNASAGGLGESVSVLTLGEDAMQSSCTIWAEIREQLFDEARLEQEFSEKVATEIISPMMSFYQDAEKKRKVLLAHHQALSGQMRALTEQLLQAKIATVKQIQLLQLAEAKERDASAHSTLDPSAILSPPPPSPAPKVNTKPEKGLEQSTRKALASVGNFFKGLKDKASSNSSAKESSSSTSKESSDEKQIHMGLGGSESSEELREKVYAAALSYQLAVSSSNSRQAQFYRSDLPTLFSELQRLEIARLNCLKHYLGLLAAANLSLVSPNKQRIQSLIQSVSSMHSEVDCREFVELVVQRVGETEIPNEYAYDLQYRPEQIRQGLLDDASNAEPSTEPSFFTSTLQKQMELQESRRLGESVLDIPIVFHTLLQAIRERHGYNRSNLLYLAADRAAVDKLRAQFESGNFDTKHVGLEILAALLKVWLRSLPEPLLPVALYAAAISAIKKEQATLLSERQLAHEAAIEAAAAAANPQLALDGSERIKSTTSSTSVVTTPASPAAPDARPRSSSNVTPILPPMSLPTLPSAQLHQYVLSILSALPTLNQRVITQLANLLSEIASSTAMVLPSASSASDGSQSQLDLQRWSLNVSQASHIFTSVVLRNTQADATELLLNASKETRFTSALFLSIGQQSLTSSTTTAASATANNSKLHPPSAAVVAVASSTPTTASPHATDPTTPPVIPSSAIATVTDEAPSTTAAADSNEMSVSGPVTEEER